MKKSLLCCSAICALSLSVMAASETPESIKENIVQLLSGKPELQNLVNTENLTVVANGQDFEVTIPAVQTEDVNLPEQKIHLEYVNDFNGYAQYKIGSVFETIQELLKSLLPEMQLTTESAQASIVWVPHYNMVTQNSQNIKGLQLTSSEPFQVSVGSFVSDMLMRVTGENKMDRADSQDISNIRLVTDEATVAIPSFTYQDTVVGSMITPNGASQIISSENAEYNLNVPAIFLIPTGSTAPIGSVALSSSGNYRDNVFHMEALVNNIALDSNLRSGVPAILIPTEVKVNIDLLGMGRDNLKSLFEKTENQSSSEEFQAEAQNFVQNIVTRINLIEAKNAEAGIALSGTVKVAQEKESFQPIVDLSVVITNFDKVSPAPVVNEAQCSDAKAQLEAIDDNDPDANAKKMIASFAASQACEPQGGILDDLRPYMDETKRETKEDGSVTDRFDFHFENETLIINGKEAE